MLEYLAFSKIELLVISKLFTQTLLTGSWDKTARVWIDEKSVTTLKGHEGAVWCAVILPNVGIMVTGSADYTLRLWKGGKCLRTITGIHTQAVRGIDLLNIFIVKHS